MIWRRISTLVEIDVGETAAAYILHTKNSKNIDFRARVSWHFEDVIAKLLVRVKNKMKKKRTKIFRNGKSHIAHGPPPCTIPTYSHTINHKKIYLFLFRHTRFAHFATRKMPWYNIWQPMTTISFAHVPQRLVFQIESGEIKLLPS